MKNFCKPLFKIKNQDLMIGQQTAKSLYERFKTPFYAYDKAIIQQQIEKVRTALPDRIECHYALKANPMPEVINYIAPLVQGMDVASAQEMQLAINAGVDVAEISFAGPAKTNNELSAAIQAGVTLNIESVGELKRIITIAKELNLTPQCAVRVNPDFELKASGMKMAGGAKPFGIDSEKVPDIIRQIVDQGFNFRGLHIFSGSQNLHPEALIESQTKTIQLALDIAEQAQVSLAVLNIGGGFGVPYFAKEKRLDLVPIMENLAREIEKVPSQTKIVIELGRYLVAEAGVYICEVIDRKESRGTTYLTTNGGLHHHLAASGNFGQILRKDYPVALANKMNTTPNTPVSIVGALCTPIDIIAKKIDLFDPCEGDLVAIFQSGAYGFSASPHQFLSHPMVKQILL